MGNERFVAQGHPFPISAIPMEDDSACKAALRTSPSRRNRLSEAKKVSCSERADEQYVVLEEPARHAKSHWGVSYAVEHRPSRSEERRYERKGRLGRLPRHLRSPSASRWFVACHVNTRRFPPVHFPSQAFHFNPINRDSAFWKYGHHNMDIDTPFVDRGHPDRRSEILAFRRPAIVNSRTSSRCPLRPPRPLDSSRAFAHWAPAPSCLPAPHHCGAQDHVCCQDRCSAPRICISGDMTYRADL